MDVIIEEGAASVSQEIMLIYEKEILDRDSSWVNEEKFVGGEPKWRDKVAEKQFKPFLLIVL